MFESDLSFIESNTTLLSGLTITVVGAGPAGLTFARFASTQGARVTLLEQADEPWGTNPGYTDRSFNITLDEVGRQVLADERAWRGGTWLSGRALHQGVGATVRYGSYGPQTDTHLVSIPRPVLRRNLASLAIEAGADLRFRSHVTRVDPDAGLTWFIDEAGREHQLAADLVVVGDGLHSLADSLSGASEPCSLSVEPRNYIIAMLGAEYARDLSPHHIHFWHENNAEAYAIGLPNSDGSVALLFLSNFPDIAADVHPFASPEQAALRLKRDFPQLYARNPALTTQLTARRRGVFYYKQARSYTPGARAVIVGDAGCVVPPWAGFGANGAMYGAAVLVSRLVQNACDLPAGLAAYEQHQRALSGLIMQYVRAQGDFLSGPVQQDPNGRSDSLKPLIRQAHETAQSPAYS